MTLPRFPRRTLVLSVLAAGALAIVATALAGAPRRAQSEQLAQLERARTQALADADIAAARQLMAPDFQLINPAGQPLSREELLEGVRAGQPDFLDNAPTSAIAVRQSGAAAVLRYQRSFDLVIAGMRLTHKAWTTVLYEHRHGHWVAVWEQTTAIPNRPDLFIESIRRVP
ncbi:MAG TPA: nuclear transport factor 2 family protein [Gaiellaceae bacterium]|jgi:hypothetical protein